MCLAIPGRLVSVVGEGELRVGDIDFGGVVRATNLAFVPEANVGDFVLVHVGFAIATIDEDVARETLEALAEFEALTDGMPARAVPVVPVAQAPGTAATSRGSAKGGAR